jgi:predicted RNA-binding Zn-ribbon protein involved in translation (DUF1610 family)
MSPATARGRPTTCVQAATCLNSAASARFSGERCGLRALGRCARCRSHRGVLSSPRSPIATTDQRRDDDPAPCADRSESPFAPGVRMPQRNAHAGSISTRQAIGQRAIGHLAGTRCCLHAVPVVGQVRSAGRVWPYPSLLPIGANSATFGPDLSRPSSRVRAPCILPGGRLRSQTALTRLARRGQWRTGSKPACTCETPGHQTQAV